MNPVRIRLAAAGDEPGLVAVVADLIAEDPGTRDPSVSQQWPHRFGLSSMKTWMADTNWLVLAATDGEAIVGILTGFLTEPTDYRPVRIATLHSLYVNPAYRDGGVGAQLVAKFRSWARNRQAQRMSVTAYAANTDAIRFYQRHAFTPRLLELDGEP